MLRASGGPAGQWGSRSALTPRATCDRSPTHGHKLVISEGNTSILAYFCTGEAPPRAPTHAGAIRDRDTHGHAKNIAEFARYAH